jgi:hypothetical protein
MKFDKILTTGVVWITSDTHYNAQKHMSWSYQLENQDGKIPIESTRDLILLII